jgi:ribose-phosphate pyrophosphokinase
MNRLSVFSGTSNPQLAKSISEYIGKPLGKGIVSHFPDGETLVKINEDVRGQHCFVIQSTSPPVNDNLMELLIYIDCLRRASAASITAVVPYFGYARQDRKTEGRTPITARMVADMITMTGVDRVVTLDLHSKQIEGFFNCPVDNLKAVPVFVDHLRKEHWPQPYTVVLSPDTGSTKRANEYGQELGFGIAVVDKRRLNGEDAIALSLVGDVDGKHILIFDDMISTAGTIVSAAKLAKEKGAESVEVFATHGLFTGPAVERLMSSGIDAVTVSDTIVLNKLVQQTNEQYFGTHPHQSGWPAIRVVSMAKLLGEAILRIYERRSVSQLLKSDNDRDIRFY